MQDPVSDTRWSIERTDRTSSAHDECQEKSDRNTHNQIENKCFFAADFPGRL